MGLKWSDLLNEIEEGSAPADLFLKIQVGFRLEKIRRARRSLAVFGFAGAFFAWIVFVAWPVVSVELGQTNFFRYFSLFFSDSGLMFSYWRDFGTVLLESLPFFSLIIISFSIWSALWLSRGLIRNYGIVFGSSNLK